MKKDSCQFCKAIYPDEIGQIIKEGNVTICRDCYERLIFENLPIKKAYKRVMACKKKGGKRK